MQYGNVPAIDKPISRIVQGTTMLRRERIEENFAVLDAVLAAGCTAFDTAHVYGGGDSERVLGQWVNDRGVRDKVVLIDKGCHHSADRRRVTPFDITADLHDNLARLESDYIDLWLFHRDDPDYPVGPVVERLNEHVAEGKIRAFGGSNWTHERLAEANAYAAAHGLVGFAASSPPLALVAPAEPPWAGCVSISGPDAADARGWYEKTRMPLFCWSSLCGGFLTGRFRRDNLDAFGPDNLVVRCYCNEENFRTLDQAEKLAAELGATLPQVALAYLFGQPLNAFALTACMSGAEYAANAAALDLKLPEGTSFPQGQTGPDTRGCA